MAMSGMKNANTTKKEVEMAKKLNGRLMSKLKGKKHSEEHDEYVASKKLKREQREQKNRSKRLAKI